MDGLQRGFPTKRVESHPTDAFPMGSFRLLNKKEKATLNKTASEFSMEGSALFKERREREERIPSTGRPTDEQTGIKGSVPATEILFYAFRQRERSPQIFPTQWIS